MLNLIML